MKKNNIINNNVDAPLQNEMKMASDLIMYRALFSFSVLVVALYCFATFVPSSQYWGIHHLAFMPMIVQALMLAGMMIFFFPKIQLRSLEAISTISSAFNRKNRLQTIILTLLGLIALGWLFWVGRERLFLLGDGNILIRKIINMTGPGDIPEYFPREPLTGLILYYLREAMGIVEFSDFAQMPYRIISIVSGIGFVLCSGMLARSLFKKRTGAFLFFLFITGSGVLQLFFGYIEMYALSSLFFVLFLYLVVNNYRGNIAVIYPVIAFVFAVVTHLAMICFLPAVLYMLYRTGRRNIVEALIAIFAGGILAFIVYWLCGFSLESFSAVVFDGKPHTLPLVVHAGEQYAYSLFSMTHGTELVQLYLLISPFVLFMLACSLVIFRKEIAWHDPFLHTLLLSTAGGILLIFTINPELGMSRDWDAFAPLFISLVVTSGVVVLYFVPATKLLQRAFIMVASITMLHVGGWVALNANEERSLTRFETLPSEQTWRKQAIMTAYEELAVFHRSRKEGPRSVEYYRKYLSIDSTNPRIWASLGYVYKLMGDEPNQRSAYESAARRGLPDMAILMELGMLEIKYRNSEGAKLAFQKAVSLDALNAQARINLAQVLFSRGEYNEALEHFERTIELAPNALGAYVGAIYLYLHDKNKEKAKKTFEQYLRYAPPNFPQTDSLRKMLGQG
ncbi:MAG: tetratricopeptide repeat protein [Bacteroidetes bacterium]|nr:MAG: tetratricopeptide repeat protein [Bacteroidota bacterium]